MGYTDRVIIFAFWGRQENIELQLPFIERILKEHPNVEFHGWNFAGDCGIGGGRKNSDRDYIASINGPQITIINDVGPMQHNRAYRHYYEQPEYKNCLLIKIDDDVVFLETARFGVFLDAIDTYRNSVVTANIVHNGACTPVEPGLWKAYTSELDVPLLEVHEYSDFAEIAHGYFFSNWRSMIDQPVELIPTEDWLSINAIGFDWRVLRRVVDTIGKPHPRYLAGRLMRVGNKWPFGRVFGNEGAFQALPRLVVRGFTAAHLTYGPQRCDDERLTRWRDNYCRIGKAYLEMDHPPVSDLPAELSAVSCAGPRNP